MVRQRRVEVGHGVETGRGRERRRPEEAVEIDQGARRLALARFVQRQGLEGEHGGVAGMAAEVRVTRRHRGARIAVLQLRVGQVYMRLRIIGRKGDGAPVSGFRLIQLVQFLQGVPQVDVDRHILRFDAQGAAVGGDGIVVPAGFLEHDAEVVMGVGVVGFEDEGTPVGGLGLVHPAEFVKGVAQVVLGVGEVGRDIEAPPLVVHGFVEREAVQPKLVPPRRPHRFDGIQTECIVDRSSSAHALPAAH
ncbi:MAG: hypothetical protein O6829_11230, partial [Alphaproteobacteria bacterium]|nr:hypothetical protein [Alphaproteobacteria bacterium]